MTGMITNDKEAVASTAVYLGLTFRDLNLFLDQIHGLKHSFNIFLKSIHRSLIDLIGTQVFLVKM